MTDKKYPRLTPKLLAEAERENRWRDRILATPAGKFCMLWSWPGAQCRQLSFRGRPGYLAPMCAKFSAGFWRLDWPPGVKRVGYGSYQFEKPVEPPHS